MRAFKLLDGTGTFQLKHLIEDTDRHGNVRIYLRSPGRKKIRLREKLGSDAFFREYKAALAGKPVTKNKRAQRQRASLTQGTFHWLCCEYFQSSEYRQLSPRTQYTRRNHLERLCRNHGDKPFAQIQPRHLRIIRDSYESKPGAANEFVKALRAVFKFAYEDRLMEDNPARDLKKFNKPTSGHHSWTIEEIRQFEATHPIGSRARLAFGLFLYTGQRRADIARMGPQHIKNGWLEFTQHKNRNRKPVEIVIPILPELQFILDSTPTGVETFVITEHGKPYSIEGLGMWFRKQCDEAGLKHCSAHGLRKAGAVLAAENGATPHQLMAIFGWSTLQQAEHYTKSTERRKLAGQSMHHINLDQN